MIDLYNINLKLAPQNRLGELVLKFPRRFWPCFPIADAEIAYAWLSLGRKSLKEVVTLEHRPEDDVDIFVDKHIQHRFPARNFRFRSFNLKRKLSDNYLMEVWTFTRNIYLHSIADVNEQVFNFPFSPKFNFYSCCKMQSDTSLYVRQIFS